MKKKIVKILEEISKLLEFKGENNFKVSAFRNGANTVRHLPGEIEPMIEDGSIKNVKGIGKGILAVINDVYETGESQDFKQIKQEVPEGITDVLNIRGLGAKKVKQLYDELGIDSIECLEDSISAGKLDTIKGFGKKTQDNILEEIKKMGSRKGKLPLNTGLKKGKEIISEVESLSGIISIQFTGELRRVREVISSLEFLVVGNSDKLKEKYSNSQAGEANGIKYLQTELDTGTPVRFWFSSADKLENQLFITTGSDGFIKKLNTEGSTEKDILKNNKIEFVIPEMRETEFIDAPKKLQTNSNLDFSSFNALLHFHTTYSDGGNSLDEMAAKASEMGFKYASVCDHSKAAFYADGLNEERVLEQQKEINEFNSKNEFKIISGIESDILNDGSLDYPEEVLKTFGMIVASIHSNLTMDEEKMTARIIKAVENPYTDILAHPSGRLLLSRDSFKVDMKKVLDACAANDVVIEINANPRRLELDWRHIYYAREKGLKFAVNPDAHSTVGIEDVHYGIMIARKCGIQSSEVINCYNYDEFKKFLNRKVKRKLP